MSRSTTDLKYVMSNIQDHTLDDINGICRIDNGQNGHPLPNRTLGTLERLPSEILHIILTQLTIQSLTNLRRVNRRALQTVYSIPQYRAIATHAPAALCGILSIGLDSGFHAKISTTSFAQPNATVVMTLGVICI